MDELALDVRDGATVAALLGALVESGASLARIERDLASLGPGTVPIALRRSAHGSSLRLHAPTEAAPQLAWGQQRDRIALLAVDPVVARDALAVLERVTRARALVHRQHPAEIELDVLAGLDEVAEAIALVSAVASLGSPSIATTAVGVGGGCVSTAFGDVDLPGPVVTEILHGRRTLALDVRAQVVDPIGAAFLAAVTHELSVDDEARLADRDLRRVEGSPGRSERDAAGARRAVHDRGRIGRGAVHTRDGDAGAVVAVASWG